MVSSAFLKEWFGRIKYPACLLAWFLCLGAGISASAQFTAGDASIIFNAYTTAFYRSSGQNTYFQNTQTGGGYTTFWEETEEIECVIDAYEWTTNATYKTMITNLLNGFVSDHGSSWTTGLFADKYNDDVMWATMTFARGGMDTGRPDFCNIALLNFTNCYARAWSTNYGGGLWWDTDDTSKNACVNGPGAIAAYLMYQIYGGTNYWNESSNIYFWERSVLYNGAGKIYDHVSITNGMGTFNTVATTYNQGTFIGAANFLGQTNDAMQAANYTMNSMGSGGIMPQYGIENNNSGFNAIFIRWMARYMKNRGLQSTYQTWLQQNANAAWNLRRTSDNLSWCQWLQQTPAVTNLYSWDCISSLEALQAVPPTITNSPPEIVSETPVVSASPITLYAGVNPVFSITAIGSSPLCCQWFSNSVPVTGATNAGYTLPVSAPGVTNNYNCIVTNSMGSATSSVWSVTVIPSPIASYPEAVLALKPAGYWPLNESPNNGSGNQGVVCRDYAGGNNGVYSNAVLVQSGYNTVTDPAGTAAKFGSVLPTNSMASQIGGIDFSTPTGGNAEFTVMAWVNGQPQTSDAGMVTKGYGGGGEQFNLDTGSDSLATHGFRFFVRDASGAAHVAASAIMPDSNWHHLAGVCDESNGAVHLYIDGVDSADAAIAAGSGLLATAGGSAPGASLMSIGSRAGSESSTGFNYQFIGTMDEVAIFNSALSSSQIQALYVSAPIPVISMGGSGTNMVITYTGTLLCATNVAGPYTPVSGAPWPSYVISTTNSHMFYRVSAGN